MRSASTRLKGLHSSCPDHACYFLTLRPALKMEVHALLQAACVADSSLALQQAVGSRHARHCLLTLPTASDPTLACSKHWAAEMHAAARAISGGSVYVSDFPGIHDYDILRQLVLPDGTILRGLLPGRPARSCLFSDVLRDHQSLLTVRVLCWCCFAAVVV